jgi:endonuclease/exonuclease/phosphatase family metal-dependent hydrolase
VTARSFHAALPEPASKTTDFLVVVNADILILEEVDLNARRTHRLNIAKTIARKLEMNYVFGHEFEELVQGSSEDSLAKSGNPPHLLAIPSKQTPSPTTLCHSFTARYLAIHLLSISASDARGRRPF